MDISIKQSRPDCWSYFVLAFLVPTEVQTYKLVASVFISVTVGLLDSLFA